MNDGRLGVMDGALLLGLSKRQIFRLLVRFQEDGPSALRHKARGKAPNNIIQAAKRSYALVSVQKIFTKSYTVFL